jgi:hypothetical protein
MKTKTIPRNTSERRTASAAKTAREINNPELAALVNTAWHTAYTSLWNCTQFSTSEIDTVKKAIGSFLQLHKTPEKGFIVFCQRIAIAKPGCRQIGLTGATMKGSSVQSNALIPLKEPVLPCHCTNRN